MSTTTVVSWDEAFGVAEKWLNEGKLTAVAIVSRPGYSVGAFVATHLEEFGNPKRTLQQLLAAAPLLHGERSNLELIHGSYKYPWRDEFIDGWLLAITFPV